MGFVIGLVIGAVLVYALINKDKIKSFINDIRGKF